MIHDTIEFRWWRKGHIFGLLAWPQGSLWKRIERPHGLELVLYVEHKRQHNQLTIYAHYSLPLLLVVHSTLVRAWDPKLVMEAPDPSIPTH